MFDALWNLFDFVQRHPSLMRSIRRKDRVSYPPSSPLRRYRKGTLFVMLPASEPHTVDPEVERGMQRALDRVFGPDSAPGPGDSDE